MLLLKVYYEATMRQKVCALFVFCVIAIFIECRRAIKKAVHFTNLRRFLSIKMPGWRLEVHQALRCIHINFVDRPGKKSSPKINNCIWR